MSLLPLHELINTKLNSIYNVIGKPRLVNYRGDSGNQTVTAGSTNNWLSISGSGLAYFCYFNYSSGISPANSLQDVKLDDNDALPVYFPNIYLADLYGLTAVGNYNLSGKYIRIHTWDTTNNVFYIYCHHSIVQYPFGSKMTANLKNVDTVDGTMREIFYYSLFAASKRLVLKMRGWKDPKALRKALGLGPEHPVIMQRLGFFENEEEHPYREFLKDFPIRSDFELELKDGIKVKACTPKSQHIVAEVFIPENWSNKKVLDVVKPYKLVYEEVI